jgi:DNA-binding NarL/FixJ family response regulator
MEQTMTPENAPLRLKVLVIGDDPTLRRGVVQYIRLINPSAKVDEAANHSDADDVTRNSNWDLILLDLEDANELAELHRLKRLQLNAPILVLTTAATPDHVAAALAAGASGCLSRGSAAGEWKIAIENVASGSTYLGVRP